METVLSILLFAIVIFVIALVIGLVFRIFGWSATKIYSAIKNIVYKIKNKRLIFAILWSVLSIVGVMLYKEIMDAYCYLLFGFHTPVFSVYIAIMTGWFSDVPETFIIYFIFGLLFIITWIISLIRINKSHLFEYMILVDRIITLLMFVIFAVLNFSEFVGWGIFSILAVEILIITGIIIAVKTKRKRLKNIT